MSNPGTNGESNKYSHVRLYMKKKNDFLFDPIRVNIQLDQNGQLFAKYYIESFDKHALIVAYIINEIHT